MKTSFEVCTSYSDQDLDLRYGVFASTVPMHLTLFFHSSVVAEQIIIGAADALELNGHLAQANTIYGMASQIDGILDALDVPPDGEAAGGFETSRDYYNLLFCDLAGGSLDDNRLHRIIGRILLDRDNGIAMNLELCDVLIERERNGVTRS